MTSRVRLQFARCFLAAMHTVVLAIGSGCSDEDGKTKADGSVATELGLTQYAGRITPELYAEEGGVLKYRYNPAEGPVCMRGGRFYTGVRDVGSKDVAIFLQEGGLCWSGFCMAVNVAREGIPKVDILDPLVDFNPVAGWNHVFVPYCDGSFLLGDAQYDDNIYDRGTRYHYGLANLTGALEVAKSHFPDPARVLLSGSSGGSYGLLLAGFLVRHYFPRAELVVMADSGIGIGKVEEPGFLQSVLDEFNMNRFMPADCPACRDGNHLTGLIGYLLRRDPTVRVGMYSSWYDSVLASIYLQIPAQQFADSLRQQTDRINAAYPDRFRRFITDGVQHTSLPGRTSAVTGPNMDSLERPEGSLTKFLGAVKLGNMEKTQIDGVNVATWLNALIRNDLGAWVDLLQPPGPPPAAE